MAQINIVKEIEKQIAINNARILSTRIQMALVQQSLNIIEGYYDQQFAGVIREYHNHENENY